MSVGKTHVYGTGLRYRTIQPRIIWESIGYYDIDKSRSNLIWHKLCIPRYAFISGVTCPAHLPTRARIGRFGYALNTECFLRIAVVETQDHLLLACPYSNIIFKKVFPNSVPDNDIAPVFTSWSQLLYYIPTNVKRLVCRSLAPLAIHLVGDKDMTAP